MKLSAFQKICRNQKKLRLEISYESFVVGLLVEGPLLKVDPLLGDELAPGDAENLLGVVASRQFFVRIRRRDDRLKRVGQEDLARLK